MTTLDFKDVECLIAWPKGTIGAHSEAQVLMTILHLCNEHGYGRISQLTAGVEQQWRKKQRGEI